MAERMNNNNPASKGNSNNSNSNSNYAQNNNNSNKDGKFNRWQGQSQGNNYNDNKDYTPKDNIQKQPYQLRNKFHLSFMNPNDNITNLNYEKSIIPIGDIETIEDYFNYYCHIYRPQDLQSGSFYLFLKDIQPMWEDQANKGGGRFNIRMKKGFVNKIWEDLIMGFLGETCEEKDLLNGFVLQIKQEQDIIQLWIKDSSKSKPSAKSKIQTWIAETIGYDPALASQTFIYQPHQKETKSHAAHKSSANPVRKA
ncbi:hypothetical protein ABPG74_008926 [Tetrahymena malaccensis]